MSVLRMVAAAVTFIVVLGCLSVCSLPSKQSVAFSMVFSPGTRLLVDVSGEVTAECDEDDDEELRHHHNKTTGSSVRPSVQILSAVRSLQDPGSPRLLVCLLHGLSSARQRLLWWIDDTLVRTADGPWAKSVGGYCATSVWEVSASEWRPDASYSCGTIQEGRELRQELCKED